MAKISEEQIERAARNSILMTLTPYTLPHETEEYLEQILGMFLTQFGQDQIKDALAYCLRELAVNAKKRTLNASISRNEAGTSPIRATTRGVWSVSSRIPSTTSTTS